MNRRSFLQLGASAAALSCLSRRSIAGSPNGLLNHCSIGVSGQGGSDLNALASHPKFKLVAAVDVDQGNLDRLKADARFKEVRVYRDWREMLAAEGDRIDSVNIATPDHMHAVIALSAMNHGKHVYCQKPLAEHVAEARRMRETAAAKKLVTQMGNQIHSDIAYRLGTAWIKAGAIGKIREVHSWTGATFPQKARPAGADPVPANLTGTSGSGWRRRSLQAGALPPVPVARLAGVRRRRAGRLRLPHLGSPVHGAGVDGADVPRLGGPAGMGGGPRPLQGELARLGDPAHRVPGDAVLRRRDHSADLVRRQQEARREPRAVFRGASSARRRVDLHRHRGSDGAAARGRTAALPAGQVQGARAAGPAQAHRSLPHLDRPCVRRREDRDGFHYSGPLAEAVQLGNIANRFPGRTLEWDAAALRITNLEAANALPDPPYRDGWKVLG
ncbi:MAG: Gfo/Idh/MocA family oxidoreductase [Kiritimatiellia bacterium]